MRESWLAAGLRGWRVTASEGVEGKVGVLGSELRFTFGLANFFSLYQPIADSWQVWRTPIWMGQGLLHSNSRAA